MLLTLTRSLKAENNNFCEQITMYQESLESKDSVVVSLTNRIAELEGESHDTCTQNVTTNTPLSLMADSKEIAMLKVSKLHVYY